MPVHEVDTSPSTPDPGMGVTPSPSESIPSTLPEDVFCRPAADSTRLSEAALGRSARTGSVARVAGLLRRGSLIDKYQIEEVLGVGGFAVVYRGTHLLLRSSVALKLLRQDVVARRPAMRSYLIEEARLAARINHPNVVRIYDAAHSEQLTYLVMEFIDGPALSRRLDHGPLDVGAVLHIGMDVATGLRAGLQQDLIHRDVKPANILLAHDGTAKLVDFGMAHEHDAAALLGPAGRPVIVGTRGYMAPEQTVDSSRIDFRADIYALGVTLFEAATGARPRTRSSATPPALPSAFLDLVRWMRSPPPDARPASYDLLLEEMERTLRAVGRRASGEARGIPDSATRPTSG